MAFVITPGELGFEADLFVGKSYRIYLVANVSSSDIASQSISYFRGKELIVGNSYSPITGTIGNGSFNSTTGRYDLPVLTGQFSATGPGYTFNGMVLELGGGRIYPYAVNVYDAPITLSAGQSRGFSFTLGIKR